MRTLFVNGTVRRLPSAATAAWLLVDGVRVAAIGSDPGDRPPADASVDLEGGTLVPAFCDAHVHLGPTGLYATGLDFRGERSVAAISDAFRSRAEAGGGVLFGGNFEDPLDHPITRHDLDRAVGERDALLARADMHSCVVSTTLLDRLDLAGLQGIDRDADGAPTGYLREKAASQAWSWFDRALPAAQHRAAVHAAARLAYSKGVAAVHEMFVVEWRGWPALESFRESIRDLRLEVEIYLGTTDVGRVQELGYERVGGDLFLDGSFGSHTAWMKDPYVDPVPAGSPQTGIAYRSDRELLDFFTAAQSRDMQAGVHAIGDAAIEQAISTWERVADHSGADAVRRLGHRIEHFECASDDHIVRASRLGLRASMQPAFDRFWGGKDGLYARRIGWDRAQKMNRFASVLEGGLLVGAGSDSTVTPLDPFLQLASLRSHHDPDQSLGRIEALRLLTIGAHALVHGPSLRGTAEPGAPAHLALLDRDPGRVSPDELMRTEVLGTWIAGNRVWPDDEDA